MQNPELPERFHFTARVSTRWSDVDVQAVLNNAVYLTLLEEARYQYFDSLRAIEDGQFPFLLAQTNVRFLRPGRGGVEVEIDVATGHLGRSSIQQAYRVRDPRGEIWCEAQALLVCHDPERGGGRAMPANLRQAVAEREGLPVDA
jgi:acyl-CoA thioester hydrolase